MMKSIVLLSILISCGVIQSSLPKDHVDEYPRASWHREIGASSPVATEEIFRAQHANISYQGKISIGATVHNLTDHDLRYVSPEQYYEVRASNTGELAPVTPFGCHVIFFSECYERNLPIGIPSAGPPTAIITPHGSQDMPVQYIDAYYTLSPGEYEVVGILCAKEREGPECFKSNKIKITVP